MNMASSSGAGVMQRERLAHPERTKLKKPRKNKKPKKKYLGRIYIGRDETGKQIFEHVGRFAKKKERDEAVEQAKRERVARATVANAIPLCDE